MATKAKKIETEVEEKIVVSEIVKQEEKPKLTKPEQSLLAKKLASQASIMKTFGSDHFSAEGGSFLGDIRDVGFYPTGLPIFDSSVLGIGGIAQGKITEIYGMKSSGKSALSMFLAGMIQKNDPLAIVKIYDLEGSITKPWAYSLGLDKDRTALPRVKNAEAMADQIMADLASEFPPEVIIIDSIAVVQTAKVKEKAIIDRTMKDNLARSAFLTQFFDTLTDGFIFPSLKKNQQLNAKHKLVKLGDTPTSLLCINHAKQRTKTIGGGKTIMEWYSVGGVSLDFHACMQLMVTRIGFEGKGNLTTHQNIRVSADKNKLAPPKKSCELLLSFKGDGLTQLGTIDYLTMAIEKGLATKNGAWIQSSLLPEGKIQGADNFNTFIAENDTAKKIFID